MVCKKNLWQGKKKKLRMNRGWRAIGQTVIRGVGKTEEPDKKERTE